ncbi:MAG: GTPase HflX [Candidatus Cloacimonetes bacterium]|nr:GTPase HflX [Candidatus Cloacimonadota bacterium]
MSYDEFDELDELELEPETWTELEKVEKTAFLAALVRQGETEAETNATLSELQRLADTAGIEVLGSYTQKRNQPERSTFFGKGFLNDISQKMLQAQAELLIVNEELSPVQGRNIERDFSITVIDRTEVILSIFHDHAQTKEAKLQVRLAELEYQLPRLKRLWGHFDKERGSARSAGGSASRGMGEKQIEIDKRLIRNNIGKINKAIHRITHQKETQRKQREKTRKICLVGYTNAGKSTLFNRLTNAGVLVEDRLFATLDSTSRQLKLATGNPVVISDTVGFISNLPHHLVASFKATLMEVQDADLLLHIVDVSDERFAYYIDEVNSVLTQIEAAGIKQIVVFNKIDALDDKYLSLLVRRFPEGAFISASENRNIDTLIAKVEARIFATQAIKIRLPYDKSALVSRLHGIAVIISEDYQEEGIYMEIELPSSDLYLVQEYIKK